MKAATARRFAHNVANGETQLSEKVAEKAEQKAGSRVKDRLENFTEEQLERLEAKGAQAVGVDPAEFRQAGQTMARIKGFSIGLVVVGVTLTVGLKITSSVGSQINDSTAQQGADNATEGLNELASFLPIIGLVVAAAAVIGLVSGGFSGGGGMRGRA